MKKIILFLMIMLLPCVVYADLTLTQGDGIIISKTGVGGNVTIAANNATTTTRGVASFNASDFDVSGGAVSIDYTNGQSASTSTKGFLNSTDWNTFNGKQVGNANLTTYAGIAPSANAQTLLGETFSQMISSIGGVAIGDLFEAFWAGFKSFGQVIAAGTNIYKPIPHNCTITGWDVTSSATGNTTIDILKGNYTSFGTWTSILSTNTTANITGQNATPLNINLTQNDYLMANVTASNVTGTVKVFLWGKRR